MSWAVHKVYFMKVSVVIPVYNRVIELEKALYSLRNQTFKEFEVIIVDDGSDDDYSKLLADYADLNIHYVRCSHTANLAFIRNIGIENANGQYIAVLDSDDQSFPDRLEIQYNFLAVHKDVDILGTWVELVGDSEDDVERLAQLYNIEGTKKEIISKCLNDGCCICHSSVMMRREALEKLSGYNECRKICEDYDLWIRAILAGLQIKILPEKLIYRTLHLQSVTEVYKGKPAAISNVISIKLQYILRTLRIEKKIAIWGECERNKIVYECIKSEMGYLPEIVLINVYDKLPENVDADYSFVTTFHSKERVFAHLESIGKRIVLDYIYL